MSKLYTGKIGFSVGIVQTGAVPLDDRSVVASFNDLLNAETFGLSAYEGMLVAVVEDKQVYMLVDKANSTLAESWVPVGASGKGTQTVGTYDEAVALATSDNLGQIIFVTEETFAYMVIGESLLMKLATSTAENIDDVVNTLQANVSALQTAMSEMEATVASKADAATSLTGMTINGVKAEVNKNVANLNVEADSIQLGTVLTADGNPDNGLEGDESNVVFGKETYVSSVLQGIYTQIKQAEAGGVNSISAGDTSVAINAADLNNPKVRVNTEVSDMNTIENGHIELVAGTKGLYGVMYYDGDDAE